MTSSMECPNPYIASILKWQYKDSMEIEAVAAKALKIGYNYPPPTLARCRQIPKRGFVPHRRSRRSYASLPFHPPHPLLPPAPTHTPTAVSTAVMLTATSPAIAGGVSARVRGGLDVRVGVGGVSGVSRIDARAGSEIRREKYDDVKMEVDWKFGDLEYMEVDRWEGDMEVDVLPPNATSFGGISESVGHTVEDTVKILECATSSLVHQQNHIELRSAKIPSTWTNRLERLKYFELLATLMIGLLYDSEKIERRLDRERLGSMPFDGPSVHEFLGGDDEIENDD
ncbi:hypothetical protein INT45_010969 [Circinella minor]|uniref:Uncharacterized protein n=1 Tax=Circinella minor TaxID=1195481 RepID=A0A8H7RZG8_9FUNG|nr:hypothetical protein INT45_010969 [Circinella minor]